MPDRAEILISVALLVAGIALGSLSWRLSEITCRRRLVDACATDGQPREECEAMAESACAGR